MTDSVLSSIAELLEATLLDAALKFCHDFRQIVIPRAVSLASSLGSGRAGGRRPRGRARSRRARGSQAALPTGRSAVSVSLERLLNLNQLPEHISEETAIRPWRQGRDWTGMRGPADSVDERGEFTSRDSHSQSLHLLGHTGSRHIMEHRVHLFVGKGHGTRRCVIPQPCDLKRRVEPRRLRRILAAPLHPVSYPFITPLAVAVTVISLGEAELKLTARAILKGPPAEDGPDRRFVHRGVATSRAHIPLVRHGSLYSRHCMISSIRHSASGPSLSNHSPMASQ